MDPPLLFNFFFHVAPIRLPILDVLTLRCHRVFFLPRQTLISFSCVGPV